ncbi:MAG: hypothetical protein JSW67_09960 [Candidatus Latescibacterota bacterium]|nr:MAG: hypothetical protein JSW67_09960 [Candidatus Latescibacterota bacterium]
MSAEDYRINAEVRRHLTSRWVDVSRLQIGTTNGVVYLMGTFEPTVDDALRRVGQQQIDDPVKRLIKLLLIVDRELRRLRNVRDVVHNFRNIKRRGGTWRVSTPRGVQTVSDDDARGDTKKRRKKVAVQTNKTEELREEDGSDTTPQSE